MAFSTVKIETVAGNTAPPIQLTAKRAGVVIPLSSGISSVKLYITKAGSQTNTGHETCTITDAANGVVSYTRQAGDLPTKGSYKCDLLINYSNSTNEVLTDILLLVARARLAGE
jgi:hypothetical protein